MLIFQTRGLYDNFFLEWKLIPLYLTEKSCGRSFKFHSNLLFKSNKTKFSNIFQSRNFFVLGKTSCYDDWNNFLYFVSISVVQCEDPGR